MATGAKFATNYDLQHTRTNKNRKAKNHEADQARLHSRVLAVATTAGLFAACAALAQADLLHSWNDCPAKETITIPTLDVNKASTTLRMADQLVGSIVKHASYL